MNTNRIYGLNWSVAFGLPLVVLVAAILLLLPITGSAQTNDAPPPPDPPPSLSPPSLIPMPGDSQPATIDTPHIVLRTVATVKTPPSFTICSIAATNTFTGELRTILVERCASDHRFWKVEFLDDGILTIKKTDALDKPMFVSTRVDIGTNWVFHSVNIAEMP
jgi:hypothetical protein